MSGIVLSASVRQNLLSLQSTADLLATTQNRLATGKKVNTALDNPTNFFTAQSLDARAGDINNLLDGIGNGVQVLQAANTGITSLQKLVDTAKSIANQALQSAVGYSTKSNVSATIAGATATDLRGTTTYTSAIASSNVLYSGTAGGTTAAAPGIDAGRHGRHLDRLRCHQRGDGEGLAAERHGSDRQDANAQVNAGDIITVNGKTITFAAGDAPGVNGSTNTAPAGFTQLAASANSTGNVYTDANGNSIVYLGGTSGTPTKASVGDVMAAIDIASGVTEQRGRRLDFECRPDRLDHHRRRLGSQELDRCRSVHHRQGRHPRCAEAYGFARRRQCHGRRCPHHRYRYPRQPDPGRLDAERRWQDHHVQERADAGRLRDPHRCQRRGRDRR